MFEKGPNKLGILKQMAGPSWTKGRKHAKSFLSGLVELECSVEENQSGHFRYRLFKKTKPRWKNFSLTIHNVTLDELSKLASEFGEPVAIVDIRNVIKCFESLGLLEDRRIYKNTKLWTFSLLLNSRNKDDVVAWLLDGVGRTSEWDKRRASLNNYMPGIRRVCPVGDNRDYITSHGIAETVSASQRGSTFPRNQNKIWGRARYVQHIVDYFKSEESLPAVSISGPAGYGKTQAAICVGWRALADSVFKKVYYIRAYHRDIIGQEYVSDVDKEDLDWNVFSNLLAEQMVDCPAKQISARLRSEKSLIIFDNAETAKTQEIFIRLEPMLNPSCLLITSRTLYDSMKLRTEEIVGLEQSVSIDFLNHSARERDISSILSASQATLLEVYEFSCGAPLALEFVIGRAQLNDSLDNIIADLEAANKNMYAFYQYAFDYAWHRISKTEKSLLQFVANSPASVSHREIKTYMNLDRFDFEEAVCLLKNLYLVKDASDETGRRMNIHPWIRTAISEMKSIFGEDDVIAALEKKIKSKKVIGDRK